MILAVVTMQNSHATLASLSCLWEATARKIGNVHPAASFSDTTYLDFAASAIAIGPAFTHDALGSIVLKAVTATRAVAGQNTNLGMILLLAGLVKPPALATMNDAQDVYRAIALANPGGLGTVEHDVRETPTLPLREAMALAANRDMVARQYANNFKDVFDFGVPALLEGSHTHGCVEAAIIHCHLAWLAAFPDSLIARKCGLAVAEDVQRRVRAMMALGGLATPEGRAAGVILDTYLRSDGNKLNPGTTADLVCACLFVALREGKLKLNAPFPWKVEDWL